MSTETLDGLGREDLVQIIIELRERIATLEAEIALLRQQLGSGGSGAANAADTTPSFVKPNRPPREQKPRKRRERPHFRRRQEPAAVNEVVVHAIERCPDCGRRLSEGWVHGSRQVIEIPEAPVRVIEHRSIASWCGVCQKRFVCRPDLSGEVVGNGVFGVRLMSLVAHLRTVCRMPVRTMRVLLKSVYGLDISTGEIIEILHRVAREGEEHYARLGEALKSSAFAHADETGWREDGENGYLWSFSTPDIRYFVRDKSRGHQVPESVLGAAYSGIIVSDFYGGYNYHLGLHQRCWTHFLRDLRALKEKWPGEAQVAEWVDAVVAVYRDARAFCANTNASDTSRVCTPVRIQARERFQERLVALGKPYARTDGKQAVLAERIMRFSNELFTFVEHPQVPSENNAAERAIRPSVIDRKVSGGTRSPKGSQTRSILMSLFRTWQARGLDVLQTCRMMLTHELAPN